MKKIFVIFIISTFAFAANNLNIEVVFQQTITKDAIGPGTLIDFEIINKFIYILDNENNRINKYTLDNKLSKSFPIEKEQIKRIQSYKNNLFVFYKNKTIKVYDLDDKIIQTITITDEKVDMGNILISGDYLIMSTKEAFPKGFNFYSITAGNGKYIIKESKKITEFQKKMFVPFVNDKILPYLNNVFFNQFMCQNDQYILFREIIDSPFTRTYYLVDQEELKYYKFESLCSDENQSVIAYGFGGIRFINNDIYVQCSDNKKGLYLINKITTSSIKKLSSYDIKDLKLKRY